MAANANSHMPPLSAQPRSAPCGAFKSTSMDSLYGVLLQVSLYDLWHKYVTAWPRSTLQKGVQPRLEVCVVGAPLFHHWCCAWGHGQVLALVLALGHSGIDALLGNLTGLQTGVRGVKYSTTGVSPSCIRSSAGITGHHNNNHG